MVTCSSPSGDLPHQLGINHPYRVQADDEKHFKCERPWKVTQPLSPGSTRILGNRSVVHTPGPHLRLLYQNLRG